MRRSEAVPCRGRAAPTRLRLWTALAVAVACGDRGGDAEIAVFAPNIFDVTTLAQAALDSMAAQARASSPRLMRGDSIPPQSSALATTVERALQLAALEPIVAFVGPPSSTEALLVAPVLEESGVAMLVPTATTRKLRTAGPHVFPLAPDDSLEGEALATFAVDSLGARSATIFHIVDDYGAGLDAGAVAAFGRRDVPVLDRVPVRVDLECTDDGANPYDILLSASLLRGVPDVVVMAGRVPETACLVKAVSARSPGLPVLAGDGATPLAALRASLADVPQPRLFVATLWSAEASPRAAAFARTFHARFGRVPNPGDALLYDAFLLAGAAVLGSDGTRPGVIDWLRGLGTRRPPYEGVTGAIRFDDSRSRPVYIVRFVDGAIVGGAGST